MIRQRNTISIKRCPTGYTRGCLASAIFEGGGASGFDYQSSVLYIPVPGPGGIPETGALTSIGGDAVSNPFVAGRLLTHMFPIVSARGGSVVWSKDHHVAEFGYSKAFGVALRQIAGP